MLHLLHKLTRAPRYEREQAWHNLGLTLAGVDVLQTPLEELGLDAERSHGYANTGGPALRRFLGTLPLKATDSIIDLGCGKGGALITMARFPFQRVDGLDISPLMVDIARRNLQRMRLRKCTVYCADAAQFTALEPYAYVYMFHPFPASVVEAVMANLRRSLEAHPRPLTVIYNNPYHHSSVVEGGFEVVEEFGEAVYPIRVYRPSEL